MDINLLALNLGNSRLALGSFVAGELGPVTRVLHGQRGDWAKLIKGEWERIDRGDGAAIVAASVNPALEEPLEQAVEEATGRRVLWVGRDIELPIRVLTEEPDRTGIDRILNIAAAHEQMGKACVVVDAGTAITIDVCNDAGEFLGGAIAPGVGMMLDALKDRTARLPRVEFEPPTDAIGRSTKEAILQGVFHGVRGMVKELTEQYATELGQWPEIIATGGDAQKLFQGWELIHAVSPDLGMYGIALAYVEHHIRGDA
ncbi:MAG TPA: type III pantothenate kinase [Tepidisphaeraceae bacterium]|jgi:type III pantothenate kinase